MSDLATPLLDELTIEDGWLSTDPREKWAEYERRIKELADKLRI